MKLRLLDAVLLAIFAFNMAVMAIAIDDPWIRDAVCVSVGMLCPRSAHFAAWNKLFYDVSLGSFVSLVFYFLIVRLPARSKRLRIKRSFQERYNSFREDCTAIFLLLADGSYTGGLPDRLREQASFRDYFKEYIGDRETRWDRVANKLDDYYLHVLINEMESFREEVLYVLNNCDLNSEDDFEFLKRLSAAIRAGNVLAPGDDRKSLLQLWWELFAGWSFVSGYAKSDIVDAMIKRI